MNKMPATSYNKQVWFTIAHLTLVGFVCPLTVKLNAAVALERFKISKIQRWDERWTRRSDIDTIIDLKTKEKL